MKLEQYVDLVLDAMVKHDPLSLPMADRYKATENGIPAAVRHMTCFRTIQSFRCVAHRLFDRVTNTAVVVAEADEGSDATTLMLARIKIVDDRIDELELFLNRSRAQAGFWFEPQYLSELPEGFTKPFTENTRKATREELKHLGDAIHNDYIKDRFPCAPGTLMMESGSAVREHIDYLLGTLFEGAPLPDPSKYPPSGRLATEMPELFGGRPTDLKYRIFAIDEEQGLVAAYGSTPGTVSPYIVSDEVSTCFVPDAMIDMHRRSLKPELMEGKQLETEMRAVGMVTTIARVMDGQICGYHQIIVVTTDGYKCPWEQFYDYSDR